MSSEPFVSFVVPVRNEERYIAACLRSLVTQRYPRDLFEIIVVDGRSEDRTREIVIEVAEEADVKLYLLDNPSRSVSPGRNLGLRAARGDVIAFVEGHAYLDADFLATVADCFERTGAQCLGRYVEQVVPGDNVVQRATGLARRSWLGRNPHGGRFKVRQEGWMSPLGVATVYRRAVFDEIGLYDESFTTNEDVELNYRLDRAGIQAWFSPRLRYWLHPRDSLRGLLQQMYRYGAGKRRFTRAHPSAMRMAYVAPTALCATVLCAVGSIPVSPLLAGFFGIGPAMYFGLAIAAGASAARHGALTALAVPVALATIVCGFGAGYAAELASDLRRQVSIREAVTTWKESR